MSKVMKNVTMIAAVGKNRELGKDNDLVWKGLKEDLQFFKKQTMKEDGTGKPMAMGYKTFESFGCRPLPKRHHIVLTSRELDPHPRVQIVRTQEEMLKVIEEYGEEVMIIGGATVYASMLEYANKLILTEIDAEDKEADRFFPEFAKEEWDSEVVGENKENGISYKHLVYTRKKDSN